MEQVVCKYFQCGFCKFGDTCQKQHIKEICSTKKCISKTCIKRHPKVCKYFFTRKSCKFGELCSYKHEVDSNQSEISELKEKLSILEGSVELLNAKLSELTKELAHSKKDISEEEKDMHHKCSHCAYKASTSAVLKRHNTMKHKSPDQAQKISCNECGLSVTSNSVLEQHKLSCQDGEISPVEKERHNSLNDSLVLSLEKEERSECWTDSPPTTIQAPSFTSDSIPSSPSPNDKLFEKCAFIKCSREATKFFSFTKIYNTKYKDLLICNPCTRFIPLKELKANPPVEFP